LFGVDEMSGGKLTWYATAACLADRV
jgi:hypothetical protein